MIEIQDILNQHGDEYRRNHKLPLHILKTMIAIESCRTAELGGCVVMEQKTGIRTEDKGIHFFEI